MVKSPYRKTLYGELLPSPSEENLPTILGRVDPDSIARHFPERQQYMDFDATSTPEKLHPEASMLQEILSLIARERRQSLVVDGSLSDGA